MTSSPGTGSPSGPSTASQAGSRTMSKPGWAACHCSARPAAQQPVHLDAAVEFLAEVLPAGVGDAQAERELEHRGGAGAVDGADGGGGVPGVAVRAEVVQQSGVEQGGDVRAVPELAGLPGVQRAGARCRRAAAGRCRRGER